MASHEYGNRIKFDSSEFKELEKEFVATGKAKGFVGIGGHRLVGGCRASTYNAVPVEACEALAKFMVEFQKNNA